MTDKFIRKYMRMAKFVGEDQNPCYSRKIGSVIVSPAGRVLGTGYNGPPKKVPHCDDPEYLMFVVWPQLTDEEKEPWKAAIQSNSRLAKTEYHVGEFVGNCQGQCPRRLIGAKSGERLTLCSCRHSECNAIINSSQDLTGAYLFLWATSPCDACAGEIINAGIKRVYCLTGQDYSFSTGWLFEKAGVELIKLCEGWINEEGK